MTPTGDETDPMDDVDPSTPPPMPSADALARVGVSVDRELHGGRQSQVLLGTVDGVRAAVKFTDGRLADRVLLAERMAVAVAASDRTSLAVAPLTIDDGLVQPVGDWLITATPFVDGRTLDSTVALDARLLGRTMADLHAALATIRSPGLPTVAALDATDPSLADRGTWQILHGDVSDRNVIVTPVGPRIFDFDECGHGPVEYDVANSIYMVLFDSIVGDRRDVAARFRGEFVGGYGSARRDASAGDLTVDLDLGLVDALIDVRVDALDRWLRDPDSAPIGIRTSPESWRRTLAAFVETYRRGGTHQEW